MDQNSKDIRNSLAFLESVKNTFFPKCCQNNFQTQCLCYCDFEFFSFAHWVLPSPNPGPKCQVPDANYDEGSGTLMTMLYKKKNKNMGHL